MNLTWLRQTFHLVNDESEVAHTNILSCQLLLPHICKSATVCMIAHIVQSTEHDCTRVAFSSSLVEKQWAPCTSTKHVAPVIVITEKIHNTAFTSGSELIEGKGQIVQLLVGDIRSGFLLTHDMGVSKLGYSYDGDTQSGHWSGDVGTVQGM
jgi:hypothetical protein